ncbi:cathepsin L, putative [Perkinsus marinus ATCC 50983]|uniref:Cathepsin L, putative n=1 Tax=Perkinsus marinus (strain ATCC 50983 / TXsc) TaxID=423536 RepID=C5L8G8_PERM5|nr:cathepsin L, putative [Perkinsus marinus ATCC 50983]EER06957.1 cathepsin L, putative [Perkinsus marinus ATCC 50983]|eukprot:XP_002775141.1 cathepsin L, putative [Perkinsus marinus ATCC 50983]
MWFTAGTLHLIVMAQTIARGSGREYQLENIDQAFQNFMREYNKKYETDEQYQVAKAAFAESMREIEELRANGWRRKLMSPHVYYPGDITHEVGLNEYADLPSEVFDKAFQCATDPQFKENLRSVTATYPQDKIAAPPPSVDWEAAGALAPVRDQSTRLNKCGACYAIGATVVLESRFKIQTGIAQVVPFSVQQIVDCSRAYKNEGCDGGTAKWSYLYTKDSGIVRARSYPYKAKVGACKNSVARDPNLKCLKYGVIDRIVNVPAANEALMMQAVATGPVAVSLCAFAPPFKHYKGGIITAKTCGVSTPTHTVTIVGYNTSSDGIRYWKILNSWGKSWGMKGFAYIERTGNEPGPCNILSLDEVYPTFSSMVKSSPCAGTR